MDQVLIEFVSSLPLHGLLLIAVIVLWRDNQKLRQKMEQVRQTSAGNTAILLDQNKALNEITAHVKGSTPPGGTKTTEKGYEASPPYRPAK